MQRRIRDRNCGKKSLCIRMQRSLIQHFLGSGLHNEAQVHNGNTVRDHLHNGKVMGDKYICQLVLLLELMEKV